MSFNRTLKTKQMKKKYIILFMALGLFASCEKFLDVKPISEKPDTEVLNEIKNVRQLLFASYNSIQDKDFYGKEIIRINELFGDNLNFNFITGGDRESFFDRNFPVFNSPGGGIWEKGYTAIYRSNIIINTVENNMFPASDLDKNNLKGEALFIRALAHFELVRMFAQPYSNSPQTDPGIPIRIKALTPNEAQVMVPRNSVAEVYSQIIKDLSAASSLLSEDLGAGRANKWVAKALLARVYFNMNDFASASANAQDVINSGKYSLGSGVKGITDPFRNGTTGTVFSIDNRTGATGSDELRYLYWDKPGTTPTYSLDTNGVNSIYHLLQQYGGARFTQLYVDTAKEKSHIDSVTTPGKKVKVIDHPAVTRPHSNKFRGPDSLATVPVNVPVIRLAEMYLTRAESNAELGKYSEARADYNLLRVLAGLPEDVSTPDAGLRDRIRIERRVELALENDRFYELKRQKSSNIKGVAYNDKRILRIPISETNGNPNFQQNE